MVQVEMMANPEMRGFDRLEGLVGNGLQWGLTQHTQTELRWRGICSAGVRKESAGEEAFLVRLNQSRSIVSHPLVKNLEK